MSLIIMQIARLMREEGVPYTLEGIYNNPTGISISTYEFFQEKERATCMLRKINLIIGSHHLIRRLIGRRGTGQEFFYVWLMGSMHEWDREYRTADRKALEGIFKLKPEILQ